MTEPLDITGPPGLVQLGCAICGTGLHIWTPLDNLAAAQDAGLPCEACLQSTGSAASDIAVRRNLYRELT